MANITRIKAGGSNKPETKAQPPKSRPAKAQPAKAQEPKAAKAKTHLKKSKKPMPKALRVITWPFRMLAKPFIALGRYLRDSWHEIRQVRWPSRGATWKMVIAVLVYAGIFMVFIALLDALFTFIFNHLLG